MAMRIQLKLKQKASYPKGISTAKWLISVQVQLKYELVPVKYTFVCCIPALTVLGNMTHYCVS